MSTDPRPWLLDNRPGQTLDRAASALAAGQAVDIATGFFTLPGFDLLADGLGKGALRLLLGAEQPPEASHSPPSPGEASEPERTAKRLKDALAEQSEAMGRARDLLPFDAPTATAIDRLLAALREGRIECRRVEKQFLPMKAMLFRAGGALAVSGNVSEDGLRGQPALALGHHGDPAEEGLRAWFDALWAGAAPFDLAGLFGKLTAEYPPYLIYLRVLLQLYGKEIAQETKESGGIPVTQFQQHGAWRALRILNDFGGVLIADGVGLGKTFTAGAILELYQKRRQRVLIVCPAALRDGTWRPFLTRFQIYAECLSYEELAMDRQLGGDADKLARDLDEYALVIIDEAHNYRNPGTPTRAGVLRRLLHQGRRRDVVLLSATPVNNSLWDLYHLLRFFLRQDSALAGHGVLSLHETFDEAMRQDPFSLNPDLLYPVIDATTVKRTRRFVRQHYTNDLITMPDGQRLPLRFPEPIPSSITYGLDDVLPGFLAGLEAALMPPEGEPRLSMARYQPENYRRGEEPRESAIVGLLRSGLLKRFESSVHAFAETTAKMVRQHDLFLQGLESGRVLSRAEVREISPSDDDEEVEEFLADAENGEDALQYHAPRLRRAVEADREILHAMSEDARRVGRDRDPKLGSLVAELARIARQADEEGIDAEDRRRKRKVLVFSYYADTIDWIEGHLRDRLESDPALACYRGRLASVAGNSSRNDESRAAAVQGFAPETASRRGGPPPADRFDILLTTDVLAEGMNLQQCRNIVNYDLPWNPMRLVQRHGRIDRIGSPHARVFLRTFFPDRGLDRLPALEARVRRKLAHALASVGEETPPIEGTGATDRAFAETREEIERLRAGDPSLYEAGGTAGAAQTGEEYRQELRKALARHGAALKAMPWKAGSGLAKGKRRGHFFCAIVGERTYLRFVPADVGEMERELGYCLRLIECKEKTPRVVPADLLSGAYAAWETARQDVLSAWQRETDPRNLLPSVRPLGRELAEHLRAHPPTGIDLRETERAIECVEAPISRRDETALRAVFNAEQPSERARSAAVIAEVRRLGLEPFAPREPLPPIEAHEVHLLCWLAVEREGAK